MAVPQRANKDFNQRSNRITHSTNPAKKISTINQSRLGGAINDASSKQHSVVDNAANDTSYIKQRRAADIIEAREDDLLAIGEGDNEPSDTKRYKTANRYKHSQEVNTRNVRVSTSPGTPGYQQGSRRETTDEKFRKSYANKGLQPTSVDGRSTNKQTRKEQIKYGTRTSREPKRNGLISPGARTQKRRVEIRKKRGKTSPIARARVTTANINIWAWGIFIWLVFQIPFALLNIVFFGLASALDGLTKLDPTDSVVVTGLKYLGIAISTVADWATIAVDVLTGLDLSVISPGGFWMLTEMIIVCYAIFILFMIYLQYKFFFLRPLSGRGHSMKMGAVILALVGYTIPVLNLLPWFMVWTIAVWIHPK